MFYIYHIYITAVYTQQWAYAFSCSCFAVCDWLVPQIHPQLRSKEHFILFIFYFLFFSHAPRAPILLYPIQSSSTGTTPVPPQIKWTEHGRNDIAAVHSTATTPLLLLLLLPMCCCCVWRVFFVHLVHRPQQCMLCRALYLPSYMYVIILVCIVLLLLYNL